MRDLSRWLLVPRSGSDHIRRLVGDRSDRGARGARRIRRTVFKARIERLRSLHGKSEVSTDPVRVVMARTVTSPYAQFLNPKPGSCASHGKRTTIVIIPDFRFLLSQPGSSRPIRRASLRLLPLACPPQRKMNLRADKILHR